MSENGGWIVDTLLVLEATDGEGRFIRVGSLRLPERFLRPEKIERE
jgi:hypothetical protein